jgi:hypothetical protein
MSTKKKTNSTRELTYEKLYDTQHVGKCIAYCTDDGICPYSIKELMHKVRQQAIRDTIDYIEYADTTPHY